MIDLCGEKIWQTLQPYVNGILQSSSMDSGGSIGPGFQIKLEMIDSSMKNGSSSSKFHGRSGRD